MEKAGGGHAKRNSKHQFDHVGKAPLEMKPFKQKILGKIEKKELE